MGGNESVEVTAGIWGFLVLFGLALACWFLFRSMNAHLRRMKFTEREQARGAGGDRGQPVGQADRAGRPGRVEQGSHASGPADDPIGGGHA